MSTLKVDNISTRTGTGSIGIPHGTGITFSGATHDFLLKNLNQPITDSQTGTTPDVSNSTSDQLAIYNGSTKLWGITEEGYVVNPTLPCFIATVSGGGYTNTSGYYPASTAILNQGNHYDTSNYRFTVPIDGVYLFTFNALHNNTSSTSRPMFYINGSSTYNSLDHGMSNVDSNGSNSNVTVALIKLVAGDYVQVKSQNGNLYYYAGRASSFTGCLIG